MAILSFVVNEVLSKPALLLGLMSMIGLIALKKPFSEILSGTIKTVLGFLVLMAGANLVATTLGPLGAMVEKVFHLQGVVPTNEAIVSLALKNLSQEISAIMGLGFAINLFFALVTPVKYVFLTGQEMFYMAACLAVVLHSSGISGINLIVIGSILQGTISSVMPAFTQPFTKKITHSSNFALGHFNSLGYIVSGTVGSFMGKVGKGSKSTEEIHLPQYMSFLKESLVVTSCVMVFIYVLLAGLAGPSAIESYSRGSNYIMFAVMQGLTFGAAIGIIMYGVQMILGELVPAFQGIATRVIPNALPALDCPTLFPYAPNAVIIGFIFSVLGGIAGMFLMGPLGLALIIPGMIPHFFDGGTAGVYGNATGGFLGAVVGSFINGLLISFLPAFLLPFMKGLGPLTASFADSDICWGGILAGSISRLGIASAYLGVISISCIMLLLASYVNYRTK
jgi:PTS system ascorbate-specific IIC component